MITLTCNKLTVPFLVLQVHESNMATSEERVASWNILVHQWSNKHALRDELSHDLVFTKKDEEPNGMKLRKAKRRS